MKNLKIKDKPSAITVGEMRSHFEKIVENTPRLKCNTPLGIMEINGTFSHYMDSDTDTMWIGFALGIRLCERLNASA